VTVFQVGRLTGEHTVTDLDAYLRRMGPAEGGVAKLLPSYLDVSLEGSAEIRFPRGGWFHGGSQMTLGPGERGTWTGPDGGVTPGSYAVACFQRSGGGWRVHGVAGPVVVP
jgi:hypothetical protein